jgi:F0F1-type ATP synthase assembly protein I
MLFSAIKIFLTALIFFAITEVSKRSAILGAILVALPTISLISMIWIFSETKDVQRISTLSISIFWMVIPTLPFFLILPVLLKNNVNFYLSMFIGCGVMVALFYGMASLLKRFGGYDLIG